MRRFKPGTVVCALVAVTAIASWLAIRNITDMRRFTVVADEAAADPRGFKFMNLDPTTGRPVRFDPCTPLRYVIGNVPSPRGGRRAIHEAIRRTSRVTGIPFVYEGRTSEVPSRERRLYQPERYGARWAPLLIGWVTGDAELFRAHDAGVAGASYVRNPDGRLVYVTGTIALDAGERLLPGFGAGKTWGKVILHELGHVVGLDHVADPYQVMNDTLVSSPATWGPGDLTGLRILGRASGCLAAPELP